MTQLPILLIADRSPASDTLRDQLLAQGCRVRHLDRQTAAPGNADPAPDEVILLDLPPHAASGLAWCRDLRARHPRCRICVLFDAARESEQIGALELGADVVLVRPLGEEHLCAQLTALFRAADRPGGPNLQVGPLTVDSGRRSATLAGRPLELTDSEFDLLHLLVRHPGVVLTRDMIYLEMRGFPHDGQDRSIDLRVARLRRKLGDDARRPRLIKSVRGLGYLLAAPAG